MHPDPPLSFRDGAAVIRARSVLKDAAGVVRAPTFAGGVEQSGLETGQRRVCQRVLDGHLDSEGRVRVDVGQGQQVSGAHKEVPMEGMDGQT